MQTVHFKFSKQFFCWFQKWDQILIWPTFFDKAQPQSASIEVEIYEQYVAVYTICVAHFNFKFPDMAYNR